MTKQERLEYQREYRKRTNNAATIKYEKTINGFLMRLYANMKGRVSNADSKKAHLYFGKSILSKEEFIKFSLDSVSFSLLFTAYKESGYQRRLCPSPDRVDSSKGYSVDNIEWVTQSVNSQRGAIAKYAKIN